MKWEVEKVVLPLIDNSSISSSSWQSCPKIEIWKLRGKQEGKNERVRAEMEKKENFESVCVCVCVCVKERERVCVCVEQKREGVKAS